MGVRTLFLGYVEEAWPGTSGGGDPAVREKVLGMPALIHAHNEAAVNALPAYDARGDDFPPLCRPMFSWAPGDAAGIAYRNRLIHFAACMKNADVCVRDWLDKFERLLRGMYWESAYVRMDGVYVGTHEFSWRVNERWSEQLCQGRLAAITDWAFTSTIEKGELERLRDG
jgi:hypothetical protein